MIMDKKFTLLTVFAGMTCAVSEARNALPNIVIIMSDQQRADLCGREGFPLEITPFVDSLAYRNAWFDKAYTSMPASSPARCSMFTGRYPSVTDVRTNHNLADISYGTDMLQVLRAAGYTTALIGKNHAYLKPRDMDYWSAYGHWGNRRRRTGHSSPGCLSRNRTTRSRSANHITPCSRRTSCLPQIRTGPR